MNVDSPARAALQSYLALLEAHPIKTKALTALSFNALSEFLASAVVSLKNPSEKSIWTKKIPQMALYGFFVSGPLSHYLVEGLQRAFRNRRGALWNALQIVAANTIVSPIQILVFLTFMAIFSGARSASAVSRAVKRSFWPVIRNTWMTSPFLLAFSQQYVPRVAWTPFFVFFTFLLSTYNNIIVKLRQPKSE